MERIAGRPRAIAERLRARVREQVGLAVTVGNARTTFLAKVASAQAKPDGLLEVPPDGELAFLHPLPVEALWGVGRKTAEKLHARGITTVAQVAALSESALIEMLGRGSGRQIHALSHNRDPRRVTTGIRRRSIGSQSAIGRRKRTHAELDAYLVAIVDRISRRLRAARRVCRTVTLRLRFDDYATRATRSHTFAEPTQRTDVLLMIARALLAAAMPAIERQGITLLGVSLGNLENQDAVQLVLPLDRRPSPALDTAVDDVRERFGKEAITRAVLIGRDRGWQPPMLPD